MLRDKLFRLVRRLNRYFPDELYLKLIFRIKTGRRLDLDNPKTFSEKLQWLKLYNRQPIYSTMVDKYAVKEYVSGIIGEEYVIPTIGIWNKPEDINWGSLPEKFVLKATHSGGSNGVVICENRALFDTTKAITKLSNALNQDLYKFNREWPYKNVPKKILAEQFIEVPLGMDSLPDYKWYCFYGEPKFCQVVSNRTTKETIDFFDINWNHLDFVGMNTKVANAKIAPSRPTNIETQIRIARALSKDIPFVRVDLYDISKRVYFGEMTFYPTSGMGSFRPENYNEIIGDLLPLPDKRNK